MKNSVDSRFIRFTLKCLLRKSDYVISNSKYLLVQALSYGPDARSKALVIPNGIDMMGLNPPGSVLEEPVNTPYVISVGRFIAEKGFDILVKAFSIAGAKYPEYTLIIIGDGDEKRNLLCLKDRIGLKNRVLFLGEMKHESVLRYMALSSFVVLPSRQESFGIVLLEAMVCGKAVIGTNVGGIPEIVIDGENGLLVNPEDEFGLADAMVYLIENEEARDGLGLSGKKIAVEKFQWTGIISQYLEIYAKASGAHVS
jgi:glycosyltransferase involved in cell wall biosynthesis